jgi:hypothetical protein
VPRPTYSRGTLAAIAVSAVFTAFGVFMVLTRGQLLWPTVFFGACTAIGLLEPLFKARVEARLARLKDRVEFDDTTIRRRPARGKVESITWDELASIDIVTTDEGPHLDDVFWVLGDRDGSRGCAIVGDAVGFEALLPRLQALPGFDNGAVIQAMGSTSNARVAVWRRC